MEATKLEPMPVLKKQKEGIPREFREKLSNTTVTKFRNRLKTLVSALDEVDGSTPVRQLLEAYSDECSISGVFNQYYVRLTIDKRGDGL